MVNNITLTLGSPLRFRKNLLQHKYHKSKATDDQIKDEKVQYDINREAAKISNLSSGRTDKYEYLTGQEILPFTQKHRTIEQAKFTYFPLGKTFEKQTRTIEDQGKNKQKQFKIKEKLQQ